MAKTKGYPSWSLRVSARPWPKQDISYYSVPVNTWVADHCVCNDVTENFRHKKINYINCGSLFGEIKTMPLFTSLIFSTPPPPLPHCGSANAYTVAKAQTFVTRNKQEMNSYVIVKNLFHEFSWPEEPGWRQLFQWSSSSMRSKLSSLVGQKAMRLEKWMLLGTRGRLALILSFQLYKVEAADGENCKELFLVIYGWNASLTRLFRPTWLAK